MQTLRWFSLVLGIAVSAGCAADDTETPVDSVTASLGNQGGCSDVVLHAWDDAGTARLEIRLPPLINDAREAGGQMAHEFQLGDPDSGAVAQLLLGSALLTEACPDYGLPETEIHSELTAVSGVIRVTVTIDGEASPFDNPARVTAELESVVFADGSQEIRLDRYVFTNIRVGWLPG